MESLTPRQLAWRRLRRNKVGMASLVCAVLLLLTSAGAQLISRLLGISADPDSRLIGDAGGLPVSGPSLGHPMGIEPGTGRDVLAMLLTGSQVSLLIAALSTVLVMTIGVLLGAAAGAFSGPVDRLISWLADLILIFPTFLLLVALSNVMIDRLESLGVPHGNTSRILYLVLFFAVFGWPYLARVVRGQVLSLREREFMQAAEVMGASRRRLVLKELLPNLWPQVIVNGSFLLPLYIGAEAGLSFLGVGTDASMPTWGKLLSDSTSYWRVYPAYTIFPAVTFALTVLVFNLLGEAVRDALDPRSART